MRPGLGATAFDIHNHAIAKLSVMHAFTNASAHMPTHFLIHSLLHDLVMLAVIMEYPP